MASTFDFDQLTPQAAPSAVPAADAQRALEDAWTDGYAKGREAAAAEAAAHAHAHIAAIEPVLRAAAEGLEAERAATAERVERAAVQLALRIAEQALGAAIAAEPERVLDVVRGALRRLIERERVTVLVNPSDLELVREQLGTIVDALGGVEHCEVQAERRVPPGGAVVRTTDGEIDATLQTKLERAREVLEAELAHPSDDD
jgi:flagellar assembly protein FliH